MADQIVVWGLFLALVLLAWATSLMNRKPPLPPAPVDDGEELLWCEGCNDRHYRMWFRWRDGKFRCQVCCRDRTYARNRNRPNEGDPE